MRCCSRCSSILHAPWIERHSFHEPTSVVNIAVCVTSDRVSTGEAVCRPNDLVPSAASRVKPLGKTRRGSCGASFSSFACFLGTKVHELSPASLERRSTNWARPDVLPVSPLSCLSTASLILRSTNFRLLPWYEGPRTGQDTWFLWRLFLDFRLLPWYEGPRTAFLLSHLSFKLAPGPCSYHPSDCSPLVPLSWEHLPCHVQGPRDKGLIEKRLDP